MCVLGKEIERFHHEEASPIIGYRGWFIKNSFSSEPKVLLSETANYEWPLIAGGDTRRENRGVFSYNNKNYYNNNNKNYNYNNYYYYYSVSGTVLQYGDIVSHELGFRSQFAKPKTLVLLMDHEDKGFLDHFNRVVRETAQVYKCSVITQDEFEKS